MKPLTTTELAAFTGLSEPSVREDVEQEVLGAANPRASLVYLHARASFAFEPSVADRRQLRHLISHALAGGTTTALLDLGDGWSLDVAAIERSMERRMALFWRWRDELSVSDDVLGGEPVFPGSRLAVRHVGKMLLRGASRQEVLEDSPYLQERDLEWSMLYATAYPRVGRARR